MSGIKLLCVLGFIAFTEVVSGYECKDATKYGLNSSSFQIQFGATSVHFARIILSFILLPLKIVDINNKSFISTNKP